MLENFVLIKEKILWLNSPIFILDRVYPENQEEWLDAENNTEDESAGVRKIPFSQELYIERDDFKESTNRKFFRLTLGKEVRLYDRLFVDPTPDSYQ